MFDLIIKNGTVVSPEVTLEVDVAVKDGKIAMLGKAAHMPEAARVIDAAGKYVIPGGIDTHTHFDLPFMGTSTKDDFFEGTRAAAFGGTTTCIDFAIQFPGMMPMEAVQKRVADAEGKAVIDYALHSVITKATPEAIAEMKDIIEFGVPTFKCFMIYRKEGIMADDAIVLTAMEQCKKYNGLFGAHTENAPITEYNVEKALREGHHEAIWHALTKPPLVEAECINRALFLAKAAGVGFYDFHMSCLEGVEMIAEARAAGRPVYSETITHYLCLTKEKLKGPDGINYICSPALRDQEHIDALWKGINDGSVQTLGSDEAAFDTKQKMIKGGSFEVVPNGMPGLEFRMPVVFSEGVSRGRITVNKYVAVTSTNAAKLMGLYPRKGVIAVGSDADIVLIDPDLEKTVTLADSKINIDWNPYAGMTVKGWPVMTIARGKVIVENGEFRGQAGAGEFLKRKLHPDINVRPIL